MIRPIKIFLYFLLTAALVLFFDRALNQADISLIPPPGMFTENATDSVNPLKIAPGEEIRMQEPSVVPDTEKTEIRDTSRGHQLSHIDTVLTAPPLFRQLYRNFIRQAEQSQQNHKTVRVLHLGDSQIEADRISKILRKHFQEKYGGEGPGLIMPYDPLQINASARLSNQGTWELAYSYREHQYPGPIPFGFSGKAAWFRDREASFRIAPRSSKQAFQKARLLTASPVNEFHLRVSSDNKILGDTLIGASQSLQITSFQPPDSPSEMTFRFSASTSPLIHGIALDGQGGVAVDNLAMRGRPWAGFRLASGELLEATARHLNIGMIILQFGTNVLPTKTDDYNFYRIHYSRELRRIRDLLPQIPVLVIGVQASATQEEGEVVPMLHASKISEAQKSAALDFGMGFYDLHKSMGGKRGAIKWAREGLMLSDYMHFSARGAQKTGNQIWEALTTLHEDSLKNRDRN